ncbi:BON domain-containing protein [Micromonospora vinacea]|uniref:Osmotically-inducible protein OsmY n=1 Tax=Micromonospora vinacea TaxID=709878 RepID=A0ABS0KB21_9ACTN|nr:BON domain-containing protein [Micromonospora vinacea]MBG6105847.1 osmotically-inducible protein OsmY [Micromonospora vinacea]WSZ77993.1 BON domain-containing protein [Micromonospora sp. NBC_00860]
MYMPWPLPDENWFADTSDQPEPDCEDLRIEALVAQRLSIDWTTRRQHIIVTVQNRVVILAGVVSDANARQVAAELAYDVPGVFDICNTLRLSGPRRTHW